MATHEILALAFGVQVPTGQLEIDGPLVYWLGHEILILKRGVRLPWGLSFFISFHKEIIMKKLIGLITVIFTLSIFTPAIAFSEEGKAKKFWLQTKQSVKEAGQDIKSGVKEAGKEIKEGGKDAGKQVGDKAKSEEKKGESKAKKDATDAKNALSN